jgi:hypothetical protein
MAHMDGDLVSLIVITVLGSPFVRQFLFFKDWKWVHDWNDYELIKSFLYQKSFSLGKATVPKCCQHTLYLISFYVISRPIMENCIRSLVLLENGRVEIL